MGQTLNRIAPTYAYDASTSASSIVDVPDQWQGFAEFSNSQPSTTTTIGFFTRDPIGFYGSKWDLYAYTDSRPLVFVDPSGLCCTQEKPPRTKLQCCKAADDGVFNKGVRGLTFCCDGRVVACVFGHKVDIDYQDFEARILIKKCIQKHEDDHVPHLMPCPNRCPDRSSGIPMPGITLDMSECLADHRQLRCLVASRRACSSDDCRKDVSDEIVRVRRFMITACDAAKMPHNMP